MGGSRRIAIMVTLVSALVWSAAASAEVVIVPPRPGQVGLSLQGQYGTFLESGDLGDSFAAGPGFAVRLRYRMRYERGFGLSFESQTFDTRAGAEQRDAFGVIIPADSVFAPRTMTLGTFGVDFYQMFGTRTKTTKMLSGGGGLARVSRELNDGETDFPGDGMYVSGGAGMEKFVYQSWGVDVSGRYFAVFRDGKVNHQVQLSLGLVFYASL